MNVAVTDSRVLKEIRVFGTFDLPLEASFSGSYAEARTRFLERAAPFGEVRSYANPLLGPTGEDLATDTLWIGNPDARNVLVLVSATHGVEGFCGSAAQLDFLTSGGPSALPGDTAALLVHALNPHGFAWLRRTTEEGVDLNRNGLDFSGPLPENPGFDALKDDFLPRTLSGPEFDAAQARIAEWRKANGERAFETARSSGQYTDPRGFFYGGTEPTRAMQTLASICADYRFAERDNVAIIDYHTGLGPYGYGEPICGHKPGEPGALRCRAWYGNSLGEPLLGTSASLPIPGLSQYAWERQIGRDVMTFIALEYGTFTRDRGRAALMADHWLHAYGTLDWSSKETKAIKSELKAHYFPNTVDWNEMMLLRSRQVIGQTLVGMNKTTSRGGH